MQPEWTAFSWRFTLIRIVTDEGIEGFSAGSAMGKEREGLGDLIGGYLLLRYWRGGPRGYRR